MTMHPDSAHGRAGQSTAAIAALAGNCAAWRARAKARG
jgi:hypothetical protein